MDMYTDTFDSDTPKERSLAARIILGTLKLIFTLMIASIFIIIFVRLNLLKTPKQFADFAWTSEAIAEYEKNGSLTVGYQDPYTEYDDDGLYHISDVSFAKELGQLQLTVRYNSRSTINTLMTKYGLTERPTGETFVYILTDDDGTKYTSYRFAAAEKPLSEFRRVIFDGVDFDATENLYLHVYYGDDVNDLSPLYCTFTVYEADRWIEEKQLTPEDMTFALSDNPAYINKNTAEE